MAQTQHPLIDLVYNDKTGRYIGHLERKLLRLTVTDLKKSALLECLTGEVWDDTDFHDISDKEIRKIAVDALVAHAGMDDQEARKLVAQRWDAANPPSETALIKKFAGPAAPVQPTAVVPVSRSLEPGAKYDPEKHLRGLEQARANREGS